MSRASYEVATKAGKKDLFDISSGKEVLVALLLVGGTVAVMNFAPWLLAAAIPIARNWNDSPHNRRRFTSMFSYMKKRGYVAVEERRGEVRLSLTKRGTKLAQKRHARMLVVRPVNPPPWDGKWRLILFDVPTDERSKRNAFRSLIRRLGAVQLQKSVWLYPHNCLEEVQFLKEYFELNEDHVRLVIADSIGERDARFRKYFKL